MINQSQRISKNRIEYILKKGLRLSDDFLNLRFLPNHSEKNRFSVIVSKKVRPKATDRNLLRRQIYEILRTADSPTDQCLDIAIITKSEINKLNFAELKNLIINSIKWIQNHSKIS